MCIIFSCSMQWVTNSYAQELAGRMADIATGRQGRGRRQPASSSSASSATSSCSEGGSSRATGRPDHFVALHISAPEVVQALSDFQDCLQEKDPGLARIRVPTPLFHFSWVPLSCHSRRWTTLPQTHSCLPPPAAAMALMCLKGSADLLQRCKDALLSFQPTFSALVSPDSVPTRCV